MFDVFVAAQAYTSFGNLRPFYPPAESGERGREDSKVRPGGNRYFAMRMAQISSEVSGNVFSRTRK
jgi:hypothetical protein